VQLQPRAGSNNNNNNNNNSHSGTVQFFRCFLHQRGTDKPRDKDRQGAAFARVMRGTCSPNISTGGTICFMSPLPPPKKKNSAYHSVAWPVSIQFNCKNSTQNAPKLAFLSSKILKNFFEKGSQPHPQIPLPVER